MKDYCNLAVSIHLYLVFTSIMSLFGWILGWDFFSFSFQIETAVSIVNGSSEEKSYLE